MEAAPPARVAEPEARTSAWIRSGWLRCRVRKAGTGGRDLSAVQLLLGHGKLESTIRYLGIKVDNALELAEQKEL